MSHQHQYHKQAYSSSSQTVLSFIPYARPLCSLPRFQPRQFEYHPDPSVPLMLVGTADGDLALMNYSAGNTHIVATSNLLAGREQWRRERKRRRKCRRRKKRAEERSRQRPHLRNRTNLVNEGDDGNGGHVGGKGDTKANGEEGETNRVSLQTWRTKMLKRMYHPIDKKRHDDNDTVVNVHYERQPNNEEGDMTDSTNADGNAYNGGKLALKKSFKKARSDSPHSALYLESGACVTDGDDDSVNVNADMDDRSRDDHKNAILGICWLHDHYSYSPSIHASTVSSSSPLASSFASSSFFIASSGAGRTLLYNTGYVYDGNSTVDTDSGGVGAFNGSSDHNFYNVRACNVYSPNRKYSTRSNFIAGKGDTAGNRGVLYDVNRCKKESHASLQVVHDYGVLMKDVTSCHVNADDRMIVSSGYCKDVVISDLHTGQTIRTIKNAHSEHINISRFANHLPHTLLTCSFDNTVRLWDTRCKRHTSHSHFASSLLSSVPSSPASTRPSSLSPLSVPTVSSSSLPISASPGVTHGSKIDRAVAGAESSDDADKKDESIYSITRSESNVMCCFSDDDRYFLVSGVDNSVSQYHTIDGSLSIQYQIPRTGSDVNYSRAYYGHNSEVVYCGSSNSDTLHVCSTSTGELLSSAKMYQGKKASSLYIQSLRAQPSLCSSSHHRGIRKYSPQQNKLNHRPNTQGEGSRRQSNEDDDLFQKQSGNDVKMTVLVSYRYLSQPFELVELDFNSYSPDDGALKQARNVRKNQSDSAIYDVSANAGAFDISSACLSSASSSLLLGGPSRLALVHDLHSLLPSCYQSPSPLPSSSSPSPSLHLSFSSSSSSSAPAPLSSQREVPDSGSMSLLDDDDDDDVDSGGMFNYAPRSTRRNDCSSGISRSDVEMAEKGLDISDNDSEDGMVDAPITGADLSGFANASIPIYDLTLVSSDGVVFPGVERACIAQRWASVLDGSRATFPCVQNNVIGPHSGGDVYVCDNDDNRSGNSNDADDLGDARDCNSLSSQAHTCLTETSASNNQSNESAYNDTSSTIILPRYDANVLAAVLYYCLTGNLRFQAFTDFAFSLNTNAGCSADVGTGEDAKLKLMLSNLEMTTESSSSSPSSSPSSQLSSSVSGQVSLCTAQKLFIILCTPDSRQSHQLPAELKPLLESYFLHYLSVRNAISMLRFTLYLICMLSTSSSVLSSPASAATTEVAIESSLSCLLRHILHFLVRHKEWYSLFSARSLSSAPSSSRSSLLSPSPSRAHQDVVHLACKYERYIVHTIVSASLSLTDSPTGNNGASIADAVAADRKMSDGVSSMLAAGAIENTSLLNTIDRVLLEYLQQSSSSSLPLPTPPIPSPSSPSSSSSSSTSSISSTSSRSSSLSTSFPSSLSSVELPGRVGYTCVPYKHLMIVVGGYSKNGTISVNSIPVFNTLTYTWSLIPTSFALSSNGAAGADSGDDCGGDADGAASEQRGNGSGDDTSTELSSSSFSSSLEHCVDGTATGEEKNVPNDDDEDSKEIKENINTINHMCFHTGCVHVRPSTVASSASPHSSSSFSSSQSSSLSPADSEDEAELLCFGADMKSKTPFFFSLNLNTLQWSKVQHEGELPSVLSRHTCAMAPAQRIQHHGYRRPHNTSNGNIDDHMSDSFHNGDDNLPQPHAEQHQYLGSSHYPHSTEYSLMYLFGGVTDRQIFNDVYEFNCRTRTWRKVETHNNDDAPSPRYGQSMHYSSLHHALVIIGGLSIDMGLQNDITLLHLDTFTWETVKLHDRGVGFSPRFGHSITHTSINVKHITGFARQQASKAAMPSSSLPSMFPSASSLNGQHNDDDSEDDANAHLVVLQGGNDIRIEMARRDDGEPEIRRKESRFNDVWVINEKTWAMRRIKVNDPCQNSHEGLFVGETEEVERRENRSMLVAIEMNRLTTRSSHSIFAMGMYCSDTSDSPGNTTQHHTHSGADEGEGNSFPARCASCFGRMVYPKRCSRCKKTRYCNGTCQRNHWRVHRDQCAKMKRDTDEKRQSCNGNDGSSFDGASNADDEGDDIQHLRVRSQQSSNLLPTPSLSSSTALPSLSVSSTTVMSSVSRKSSFTSKSIAGIPSLQLPVLRVAMWGGTVIPKMKKRATKYDQQPSKEEKRGIKARMNAQEQGRVMEQIRRRNDDLDGIDVDMDLDPHGSDLDLCSGDTYYDESDTESDSSNEEEEVEEEIDEEADEDGEPEVDIPSDMVYIDIDIGSIYGILSHSQKAMIKAFYKTHGKNLQSSRQHHQHAQQLRLNECRQHNLHPVSAREWRKCRINLIGTHREPWINFGVSAAVSLSPSLSTSSSAALSVSSPISSPLPTSSISSLSSASALPLCSSSLCPLSTLINDLNQIVQNLVVKSSIQKCVAQGLTSASRMPPSSSCNPKQMVTMMVEEGKYRISVHGSILKARSHHFKVLLSFLSQQQSLSSKVLKASRTRETASSLMMDSDGEKGNASKIVQLPDVSLGVMKSILNFVYTGSIDFTDLNMSILNLYNSNDGASDTQNTNNTTTHSSADTKARMSTNTAMCTNICGDISTLSSFDCRGQISPFDLMLVADRFQLKQLVELVQNYVIASIISSSSPPSLLSPPSSVSALAATSTSITVSSISTSTIHLLFSLLHFCDRFNVTDAFQSMRDRVMMYVLTHVMAPALAESSLFSMSPSSSTPVASTSISAPVLPSSSPLHAQITQEFGSLTESTRQEIIQKMKLLHLF